MCAHRDSALVLMKAALLMIARMAAAVTPAAASQARAPAQAAMPQRAAAMGQAEVPSATRKEETIPLTITEWLAARQGYNDATLVGAEEIRSRGVGE